MKTMKKCSVFIIQGLLILFCVIGCGVEQETQVNPSGEKSTENDRISNDEYKALQISDGKEKIDYLDQKIAAYFAKYGSFPESLDSLYPEYVEVIPKTFVGNEFEYKILLSGEKFQLFFIVENLPSSGLCTKTWCGQTFGEEFICEVYNFEECLDSIP
jgi:hypothetical protein